MAALAAAPWRRHCRGVNGADLLCYNDDPRQGPAVLNRPDPVILRGQAF
jgi:hypothetical protein